MPAAAAWEPPLRPAPLQKLDLLSIICLPIEFILALVVAILSLSKKQNFGDLAAIPLSLDQWRKRMSLYNILRKIYHRIFRRDLLKEYIKRGLVVGKNFNMLDGVIIDASHTWHIEIGDDVTLAPRVHILAHDASTKKHLNYTRIGKVKIGNRVFIGASSIILPGVTIGDDVVIGAGSVVSRDIPSGHVAAGNPAKIICTIDAFLSRKRDEMKLFPRFGEEYTIRKNVTADMKDEMNLKMKDKIGYII